MVEYGQSTLGMTLNFDTQVFLCTATTSCFKIYSSSEI